jgi:hypothetical protein
MSITNPPIFFTDIFIPEYWTDANTGTLTIEYANSHYLQFPSGQGTETIPNLIVVGTTTLGIVSASTITATTVTATTLNGNLTGTATIVSSPQSVNFTTNNLTVDKQTINYTKTGTVTITPTNINASLDNWSKYEQIYTYGKSIPPLWLAV